MSYLQGCVLLNKLFFKQKKHVMQSEKNKKESLEKRGFLGADVSKGTCNFVLQKEDGKELEPNFQLDDNREGHKKLYELLSKFKRDYGLDKIIVGVESTGGYENNWYKGLRQKSKSLGLEVFRINPKLIYHETKADGQKSITDSVSANVIAGFMRKNYGSKSLSSKRLENESSNNDTFSSMKSLHKYIQRLITHNTRTKNTLEKLLYSTMPELLSIKGDKYANWFLELLIRYPSKEDILSTDNEDIISIPYLSQSKANVIHSELENSVGTDGDDYMKIAIREQALDIQQLQKKIDRLKKELVEKAKQEKSLKEDLIIVTSIGGIAADTAIGCLMEIGNVNRFEKGKSLVAFWGMNPTIKQSGDKSYYTGMSKDGSSSARAIMYMAAKNVVRHNSYFANIYNKKRNQGKSHYSAMGIVMTKLTRVIYGMLKHRKKFDSDIDHANIEKLKAKESKKKKQKKNSKNIASKGERRYQDKQSTAPVSMTQRVKRRQEQNVPN